VNWINLHITELEFISIVLFVGGIFDFGASFLKFIGEYRSLNPSPWTGYPVWHWQRYWQNMRKRLSGGLWFFGIVGIVGIAISILTFGGSLFLDFINTSVTNRALIVIATLLLLIYIELRGMRSSVESLEKVSKVGR
jgi:hypothetical protein